MYNFLAFACDVVLHFYSALFANIYMSAQIALLM